MLGENQTLSADLFQKAEQDFTFFDKITLIGGKK